MVGDCCICIGDGLLHWEISERQMRILFGLLFFLSGCEITQERAREQLEDGVRVTICTIPF